MSIWRKPKDDVVDIICDLLEECLSEWRDREGYELLAARPV